MNGYNGLGVYEGVSGMGDDSVHEFGLTFLESITSRPPPPPPNVVQVSTPNQVNTGGMPGGDIGAQYMPGGTGIKLSLKISPLQVACMQIGGTWNSATGRCQQAATRTIPHVLLPAGKKINLLLARLTAAPQRATLPVPPTMVTRILNFAPGGDPLPGLMQSLPQIGFEQREGLWIVSKAAQPVLMGILGLMTFTPADAAGNTGQVNFVAGVPMGNAGAIVEQKSKAGFAQLVDKSSVATGVLQIVFTSDPALVAQLAGASGTHALISDQPDAVVGAAVQAVNGGTLPSTAVGNKIPWVPIAAGVAVLGGIAYLATRKKKA